MDMVVMVVAVVMVVFGRTTMDKYNLHSHFILWGAELERKRQQNNRQRDIRSIFIDFNPYVPYSTYSSVRF